MKTKDTHNESSLMQHVLKLLGIVGLFFSNTMPRSIKKPKKINQRDSDSTAMRHIWSLRM